MIAKILVHGHSKCPKYLLPGTISLPVRFSFLKGCYYKVHYGDEMVICHDDEIALVSDGDGF